MRHPERVLALLAMAVTMAAPAGAQNNPPTDQAGRTAPAGTPATPPRSASNEGGVRPPTDATGQTAPAGTPVAPSKLSDPATATPSPPSTNRR